MVEDRSLAVLVATFRRPEMLARLLDHLTRRVVVPLGWHYRVIVCDNDPEGSAAAVCDTHAAVTYIAEPRAGIAAARNALLEVTAADDAIAFIDDDERPDGGWLVALTNALDEHRADVVSGPVMPEFEVRPWAALVPAFGRPRYETGAPITWVGTGNVLVRRQALENPALRFRDAYGLSGGSDSMLFLELARRGGRMVWCDEAVVHETVPASRSTLRWVLRRSFRLGNTHTRFDRDLGSGSRRLLVIRALKGAGWIVTGLGVAASSAARGDGAGVVRGLQRIARGAGMTAALTGFEFIEYRRPAAAEADDTTAVAA